MNYKPVIQELQGTAEMIKHKINDDLRELESSPFNTIKDGKNKIVLITRVMGWLQIYEIAANAKSKEEYQKNLKDIDAYLAEFEPLTEIK